MKLHKMRRLFPVFLLAGYSFLLSACATGSVTSSTERGNAANTSSISRLYAFSVLRNAPGANDEMRAAMDSFVSQLADRLRARGVKFESVDLFDTSGATALEIRRLQHGGTTTLTPVDALVQSVPTRVRNFSPTHRLTLSPEQTVLRAQHPLTGACYISIIRWTLIDTRTDEAVVTGLLTYNNTERGYPVEELVNQLVAELDTLHLLPAQATSPTRSAN